MFVYVYVWLCVLVYIETYTVYRNYYLCAVIYLSCVYVHLYLIIYASYACTNEWKSMRRLCTTDCKLVG